MLREKKRVFEPGDVGRCSKQVARNITQRSESFMVISIVVQKSKKSVTCIIEKSKSSQKTFCSEKDGRI